MTYLESLTARRDAIAEALATIGTKPDYTIDGETVSHASNRAALVAELAEVNKLIRQAQGPVLVRSRGKA